MRDRQLWAQWFDENGNGPLVSIIDGEWSSTPIHVEWQLTCLRPSACIASLAFGGMYMGTDDARELASRIVEAADLADAEWRRLEESGVPEKERFARGDVGAKITPRGCVRQSAMPVVNLEDNDWAIILEALDTLESLENGIELWQSKDEPVRAEKVRFLSKFIKTKLGIA